MLAKLPQATHPGPGAAPPRSSSPAPLRTSAARAAALIAVLSFLAPAVARAQDGPLPLVTVTPPEQATVDEGDELTFMLTRTGDTSAELTVQVSDPRGEHAERSHLDADLPAG